ncbi:MULTISPECIES: hypothetical protein [Burkholderia]|nr:MULTISPECIES: hypothetical protein [Burkholderia]
MMSFGKTGFETTETRDYSWKPEVQQTLTRKKSMDALSAVRAIGVSGTFSAVASRLRGASTRHVQHRFAALSASPAGLASVQVSAPPLPVVELVAPFGFHAEVSIDAAAEAHEMA